MRIPVRKSVVEALTVSDLTAYLKGIVDDACPSVWVEGEVSNLSRPRSGHIYLTLKDDVSQIKAVMWRSTAGKLPFELFEGQQVLAFGGVELYSPQGIYQLIVRKLEPQGIGALQLALEQLKQRLQAEGLFDPAKKKPLPLFPRRIGVVTSPSGAAIRDFLEIALRRWPGLDVTIIPCKVQGTGAATTIASAIAAAHRIKPALDVLVVTRGGGSMEDLWCFNEEPVVRAIAASRLPIVSAVGHEIDVTLADFAADIRALTPSEAAERVIPEYAATIAAIRELTRRLQLPVMQLIRQGKERLEQLVNRPVLCRPYDSIHQCSRQLDELDARGRRAIVAIVQQQARRLAASAASLNALSPLAVLSRGYSVTQLASTGEVVTDCNQVTAGDMIRTQTQRGQIVSQVTSTKPDPFD